MKIFKTIRGQLNFYFVLIFGVTLCAFSIILYTLYSNQNKSEIDKALVTVAQTALEEIQNEDITEELANELKEINVPFSSPKQLQVEILDESGNVIFKYKKISIPLNSEWTNNSVKDNKFYELSEVSFDSDLANSSRARVLVYPAEYNSKTKFIIVVASLSNLEKILFQFRIMLYIAIPLTLLLSSILGWVFSKRVYVPVTELINNSNSITANNLNTRLPVNESGDEISRLALTLNNMIERLQKSFFVLKQFTSDASHELRTPLTILKGEIEIALQKERSVSDYERILVDNLDEVKRLQNIVDGLLTLSQMESGKSQIYTEKINISELLLDAVAKINYLAKKKDINIVIKIDNSSDDKLKQQFVKGDKSKLLNVFLNLLDNAVKYSEENSDILCTEKIERTSKCINVSIKNFGKGIPSENINNIFDRFYRTDNSRTRDEINGTGLGLAIANSVVISHGGSISVESIQSKETIFTVTLPSVE